MASQLFTPIEIGDVAFPNRVVVAPMCQYSADEGVPNDWHLMHLGQYAVSGAGLVIAEATAVEAIGRITPGCLGLYNDEQEDAFARIIAFFEAHGAAVPGIQLGHAGRKASTNVPWQGGKPLSNDEGAWPTIGPSAVQFADGWHTPVEMDRTDMDRVRDAFVASAKRADRVGFKLLELHGAHGYLMSAFLSPIANHRDDEYGGSLENRMRYPLEIFEAVRAVWPKNKVLGVRLSGTDWEAPGITIEETVEVSAALKARGCDFIHVSSGGNLATRPPVATTSIGYQVPLAEKIKAGADVTTMAVGMIRDPHMAEDIIASGKADFVALARGVLYDPHWAMHAAQVLGGEVSYPNQYLRSEPKFWSKAFPEFEKAAAD
ncbi:MAG: NADH:flavin oxidoreductase/NADH oxidase [Rhodospirillaceae bacterium]|nr:NADH:flavin oxidoreductase/NADH oxidase [Rhodospirillaceae bacterium]